MPLNIIRAPEPIPTGFSPLDRPVVFLAGTVEGSRWREGLIKQLCDIRPRLSCTILDPFRPDWGAGWKDNIRDHRFVEQVEWENEGREKADYVVMYLAPEAQNPVSMLELGLCATSATGELLLCCPDGYFRKGYVDMVRIRYHLKFAEDLEHLHALVIDTIQQQQDDAFIRSRPDLLRET